MQQYLPKKDIVFVDTEVSKFNQKVEDIGAVRTTCPVNSVNGKKFHGNNLREFEVFLKDTFYVCGHNIIKFDLKYIMPQIEQAGVHSVIDTLYLSALLFPQKPYHKLLKDDKLQVDELNNPLNDAVKAMELFMDEVTAFQQLSNSMKKIYCTLLDMKSQFRGFFRYLDFHEKIDCLFIKSEFKGKICENADIETLAKNYPIELAYCLAVIMVGDRESIFPYWVQENYPKVHNIYRHLRGKPCKEGCAFCRENFDIHRQLKKKFGYDSFRVYDGDPLQESAVQAAVDGKSLLAVFPTGGGKSITFQLPALIASETVSGLTVVISPLQSLMKDQVDNLNALGITDAVTINGLLNPIERAEALERVESGIASILYISPESLRSKTIESLLLQRNVVRFVVDEAHCFSSWGQDFRVDYLYIGDFIAKLQEKKEVKIPISCFTATAKQKVISDIKEYFKQKLSVDLQLYSTAATRSNLRYEVLYQSDDAEKYTTLRYLIESKACPTIVYASRTKKTVEIAQKLYADGFNAKAFHGKMSSEEKIANQEAFIRGEVQIIVATSAFGMGVDKKDVKLVVHYDISDSLENYVQEAGRAGRDQNIQAECYVLFNEADLDKHFILLNQTKLSIGEIQQVWKGIKDLTRTRKRVCCSALEIARRAGWDESGVDIETKVKTAVLALETSGYLKRGQNCPRVYADSIQVKTANEAVAEINSSGKFSDRQKEYAVRIIKKLISTRSRAQASGDDAESRVDYIADHLGIEKHEVVDTIGIMKDEGILANDKEMSVFVEASVLHTTAKNTTLNKFLKLEEFLINKIREDGQRVNYKMMNEEAIESGIRNSTVNNIKIILYFWVIKGYIGKPEGEINNSIFMMPVEPVSILKERFEKRTQIAQFIENYFISKAREKGQRADQENKDHIVVNFSVQELKREYLKSHRQISFGSDMQIEKKEEVTLKEIEEALLYLSKINAFQLEGGFLVLYNAMEITRLVQDNKIKYKKEDYKQLEEFYQSKTQQIHIVGEYANMMVRDYEAALAFVNDYFQMEYKLFLTKYFKGERAGEINRNITPMKYYRLFENLSERQTQIINDDESKSIVVAAGPGSGKTMLLVHKLASLMLLEDVKHEQLLMLTFSRAAAMEFKLRLVDLIGNAAYFIEIKTFHSYCFDLLGKVGNIENSENVVRDATEMIQSGEVELDRITKTVLVLDEAQDMDSDEFHLVEALIARNEDMRVIAVGDDDQNIYEFRGSDSKYMLELLKIPTAKKYELVDNYRSSEAVVKFANAFIKKLNNRIKSEEIHSVSGKPGKVTVVNVKDSLEMSLVKVVRKQGENKTTAVLTTTNEQAYLVTELLNQKGFRARLIQSNEGFALRNLAEVQYFLGQLRNEGPVISDEVWNKAWDSLKRDYAKSANLEACLQLFVKFEKANQKKYFTDLESYLQEVRFEDFYKCGKEEICVSTIHKAKGKEFDTVYMIVGGFNQLQEQQCRNIYVGITRAKNDLYIFQNMQYFEGIYEALGSEVQWYKDTTSYPKPQEIVIPFSHRDVWLAFVNVKKFPALMQEVQSGTKLKVKEETLNGIPRLIFQANVRGEWKDVACSSKKCYEMICERRKKGYIPSEAKVQFVVTWRDNEKGEEYYVVLPILRMKKM